MSNTFDIKQQLVLDCEKQNQLISAGAGSGKTTVMIAKICNLILSEKVKPSELVVLTFTNQAAGEMKQRLLNAVNNALKLATNVNETSKIAKLLEDIETANIDTIDGFCSKMNKKYFYKLNLTPDTNIATGLSLEYYVEKSLEKTINNALKNNKQEVEELADCFEKNQRNLNGLKTNLLKSFNYAMAQKDYGTFLDNTLIEHFVPNKSARYLNEYLISNLTIYLKNIYECIDEIKNTKKLYPALKTYLSSLETLSLDNDFISNINVYFNLTCPTFNVEKAQKENMQNTKNEVAKMKKFFEQFKVFENYNINIISDNSRHIKTFVKLLVDFINTYQEIKKQFKVLDFTDLERMFLHLLSLEDVKNELHQQFKYIFVDEYQDINPMQDEIIKLLKNDSCNMFFVGDVKQSIYGFRQSTPEMFLDLYEKYKSQDNSESFDMNINFRSNPKILQFNNTIFNSLMNKTTCDIDYQRDAQFDAKRKDFVDSNDSVELAFFDNDKDKIIEKGIYSVKNHINKTNNSEIENESNYIVDKILDNVGKEFYDGSLKCNRIMQFKDISILARTINDNDTDILIKTLREHNIPIAINNKIKLRDSETVNLIYNILKVISSNSDDVAYTTYLRSSLIGLTFDDLYQISISCPDNSFIEKLYFYTKNYNNNISEKIKYSFDLITEIKNNSVTLTNYELVELLLNRYNLKQYILSCPNGQNEYETLSTFLSTLSNHENTMPLSVFLEYLKTSIDSKTEYNQLDNLDAINIQTIHTSKGLEYPVVILFNASRKYTGNSPQDDIFFDEQFGIGIPYYLIDDRIKIESIPRFAIKLKNKIKSYKEELRLLYVATTRPQNKLIITGDVSFNDLLNNKIDNNNFMELIYSVFQQQINVDIEKTQLKDCVVYCYNNYVTNKTYNENINVKSYSINANNLEYIYHDIELTNISLKNNVTAISKQKDLEYNILPHVLNVKENLSAVVQTDANLGTLYHKVLSKINFMEDYEATSCESVDNELIKLAYNVISPLCTNSIRIGREKQFMMYVPYNTLYPESSITNNVLVQGVVDLLIEYDDCFTIVDYKLSNASNKMLIDRYKTQLNLYKLAVEKAYNKKVNNCFIYKIINGKLIKI